jgi:putative membrane protein insertion efficiency factor
MCQHPIQTVPPSTTKQPYTWLFNTYRRLKPLWFQPLSGTCRFVPSCSQYAEHVFNQYGVWQGGWLTVKRLLKCHPWSGVPVGTVDYPPQ